MKYRLLDLKRHKFANHFLTDIYVLSNGDKPYVYGCVPNGELGISVIVAGESSINQDGPWVRQSAITVYGLVSRVQFHRMSPGYREINLGFKPEYLQLFIKERVSNLPRREAADLVNIFPKYEVESLYHSLLATTSDSEILEVVEKFLSRNLISQTFDSRLNFSLEQIRNGSVNNIEKLSREMNLSSTSLRNLFRQHVGSTPKELIRIHRLKAALKTINRNEDNLTQAAYKLGYYDQAHFIHEFKEAIGLSPRQYFQNEKLTFDFYNYQRWSYDSFAGITI